MCCTSILGENKNDFDKWRKLKKMILTWVVLITFKNLTTTWAVDYLKRRKKIIDSMFRQN